MLILSIDINSKILSISLSNKTFLFYKEIFGNFITSKYTLKIINKILIKNKLNYKNISIILISNENNNSTSIKIFFSILQILSIIHAIPLFKINKLNALAQEIFNIKKKKYIFIYKKADKINLFFFNKNKYININKKNVIKINLFYHYIDCIFYFDNKSSRHNNNINEIFLSSNSQYLDFFFRKNINKKTYMLPNSSQVYL